MLSSFAHFLTSFYNTIPFFGTKSSDLSIITKFAEQKNTTNVQISLAWMLHKYPDVVPIPGSKNQERILENLSAWNIELTDAEFAMLESALYACAVQGHRGHIESEQSSFGKNWSKE